MPLLLGEPIPREPCLGPAPPPGVPRNRSRWERRADGASGHAPWVPVARRVELGRPRVGTDFAARVHALMDEARGCAIDEARRSRLPFRLRAGWPDARADVLGIGTRPEPARPVAYLLNLARPTSDLVALALRITHQRVLIRDFLDRLHHLLAPAIDGASEAVAHDARFPRRVGTQSFDVGFGLLFHEPPPFAVARRLIALFDVLDFYGRNESMRPTEVWAWPRGRPPFRVPSRLAEVRGRPRLCRRCASPYVVPLCFGYPLAAALGASEAGELALGGCELPDDGPIPDFLCRVCGHRA